jgi:DHA1 family multidrug resistance protein-like MFS transporter
MDKRMIVIMTMLFTTFLGFGIIIPVLPVMIIESGAERYHHYNMIAAYSLASFILAPVWGGLSDRLGRRTILMVGMIGFGLSFIIFGMSGGHLGFMYASRIVGGLFSGAITACAVAYVADITSEEKRTRAMGLVGMSIGLGFIFGPAIGGILSELGISIPFFTAAAVSFLTFIIALRWLPESLAKDQMQQLSAEQPSRWSLFKGTIRYLFVMLFLVTFTLAGLESTLQFFGIARFDATPKDIGIMFLISGVVGAITQGGIIRKYATPGKEPLLIRMGFILQAIGFSLLLFSWNVWSVSVFLAVFALGNALLRPCITSLITQSTKTGQGLTSGLSSSMDSLGRIFGPLIAGGLFEINMSFTFIIGSIVSVGALFLLAKFLSFR